MPAVLKDSDVLLMGRIQDDLLDSKDWAERVIGPLTQTYKGIPDKGKDPTADAPTADRYYTPQQQKQRVDNPIDEQNIAYIPWEPELPHAPSLNDETDNFESLDEMRRSIEPGTTVPEPADGNDIAIAGPREATGGDSADLGGGGWEPEDRSVAPNLGVVDPSGWQEPTPVESAFHDIREYLREQAKANKGGTAGMSRDFFGFLGHEATKFMGALETLMTTTDDVVRVDAATKVVGTLATAGFTRAATSGVLGHGETIGEMTLGMFGGKASTRGGLEIAEQALKEGKDPELVKRATGWYKNEIGEMEYVINPKQTTVNPAPEVKKIFGTDKYIARLDDVIQHPSLYKDFPALEKDGLVVFNPKLKSGEASYEHYMDKHVIEIGGDISSPQFRSDMVHEINHALQKINNFPAGANSELMIKNAGKDIDLLIKKDGGVDEVEGFRKFLEFSIANSPASKASGIRPEHVLSIMKGLKKTDPAEYKAMRDDLQRGLGIYNYMRHNGEVKSRLASSLLHLSDEEIASMNMAIAGDVPVIDRIVSYRGNNSNTTKTPGDFNVPDVNPGRASNDTQPIAKWEKGDLEQGQIPMHPYDEAVLNQSWDKLSKRLGEGPKEVTPNESIKYLQSLETNELAPNLILKAKKETEQLSKEMGRAGKDQSEENAPYRAILGTLHRYYKEVAKAAEEIIRSDSAPEREMMRRYVDSKLEQINKMEIEAGEMMVKQVPQQQQGNAGNWSKGKEGWQKTTTGSVDRRIIEMRKQGMGLEAIADVLTAERKEALLDPISFATVQRRIVEWKKSDDYKEFTKDKVFKQREGWVSNKPEPEPQPKKIGRPPKQKLTPKDYGLFKGIDFKE